MIGQIRGILAEKKPPFLLIEVHGIGYEIQASMNTIYALPAIGAEVKLHTHFVVREDAQLLYGFANERERILFRELIKISGVGPKLALAILSGMDVVSFLQCIADRDISRLVKIPGVGKKTAERLIVEMQDKLDSKTSLAPDSFNHILLTAGNHAQQDAVSALIALGYKPQDAQTTIRKVLVDDADSETFIRLALQSIAR